MSETTRVLTKLLHLRYGIKTRVSQVGKLVTEMYYDSGFSINQAIEFVKGLGYETLSVRRRPIDISFYKGNSCIRIIAGDCEFDDEDEADSLQIFDTSKCAAYFKSIFKANSIPYKLVKSPSSANKGFEITLKHYRIFREEIMSGDLFIIEGVGANKKLLSYEEEFSVNFNIDILGDKVIIGY